MELMGHRARIDRVRAESSLELLRRLFADASSDEQISAKVANLVDEWLGRGPAATGSVRRLLLAGRTGEALRAIRESDGTVGAFRELARCWYPGLRGELPVEAGPIEVTTGLEGVRVLAAFLADHDADAAVCRAETVLRLCPMGEPALESLIAALATLVYADRADLAGRWCAPLLEQTTTHCDPHWQGMFAAIRAETAIRQGRLRDAERCARDALAHLPMAAWGVALGLPLASMVTAKTLLGKPEDAVRYLAVPVPEAMFQTPVGPHYLAARGGYRLSTGAPEEALADFLACGDLMKSWDADLAGLAAWRLGAARACLDLGRTADARAFTDEQLAAPGAGSARVRGIATRLRAATLPLEQRPAELEQAVELLQSAQDRLELAYALADAGSAYARLGDGHRARSAGRRSRHLARSSGAEPAADTLALRPPPAAPAPDLGEDLSEAERRVATLAAQGHTNRQISGKLYVTVSTVEQHLTRIYRKLGVTRRADLPVFLD
ncbi:helix-turn-helix transcriptional regulator [Acrocarpospora macrocephala]|uniref:helix-turn-helix transcriptional regulator n=1 Tax=Acrocarpospora macrocephala TaxID=150177 RepID=UPI001C3F973C|nr:helix-turn-helix transcriptional regulator [Acrocarpospora macrocephala]